MPHHAHHKYIYIYTNEKLHTKTVISEKHQNNIRPFSRNPKSLERIEHTSSHKSKQLSTKVSISNKANS